MKCPQCEFNQPAKQGMKCGKCGYLFTFNPKEPSSAGITDGKFHQAIRKAGQNGTAVFTKNQLYAAYAKIATGTGKAKIIFGCVLTGLGIAAVFVVGNVAAILIFLGAISLLSGIFGNSKPVSHQNFLQDIARWKSSGKPIENLIETPSLGTRPKTWTEEDIYQYGVERILIVQHDLLVDLMVKNNQHTEQRMLVIAESGYPDYLMPQVGRLLDERDDLPVFLLHDATDSGMKMKQRIMRLNWLPLRDHLLVDLGFFSEDFAKLKRVDRVRSGYHGNEMPADALLLGAMTLALGACFSNQSAIADEIAREAANTAKSDSSFG